MPLQYIQRILRADVYGVATRTPLEEAPLISSRLGNRVLFKREDLQPVFSFKLRGAHNKLMSLSEEDRQRGVVAASAGNHAQGVGIACRRLGVQALIVMPRTTPRIKVEAVRALGAEVLLHGNTYEDAAVQALRLAEQKERVHVHPYDDPEVIAGQGTVAVEIQNQCPGRLDAVYVPVGGGGLLAGVAAYLKYVRPELRLVGVEPDDAACLAAALAAGRRVKLPEVGLFVDGVAVSQIGRETFRVIRNLVDEVITVSVDEICAAIKDVFEDTRSVAEPAGALALAGLKKDVLSRGLRGQTLLTIVSGANTNFDRLRYISERTEISEQREALLAVRIPERPGSFRDFCHALTGRSITEFNYRYAQADEAHIFVGVQIQPAGDDRRQLIERLRERDYEVLDLSDNEMAKLHIRHMVGGRAPGSDGELLYRFEFPERPGALLHFLRQLGQRWNICLFHYRNHGAATARVLVGLQALSTEHDEVAGFMEGLGYRCERETDNPAYRLFLR